MKIKYAITIFLPILLFIVTLTIGRFEISLSQILQIIQGQEVEEITKNIFLNIRLPRALFALLAGGVLGITGAAFQSIFQNPIVSSDTIGVSSGATLGAAIAILFFKESIIYVEILAFVGGMTAMVLTYSFSSLSKYKNIVTLILAGIIVKSFCEAGITFLKYTADPMSELPSIEFWRMGSLNKISWTNVKMFLPSFVIFTSIIMYLRWPLDALALGDESAKTLGLSVVKIRNIIIISSTILISAVSSAAGVIGWVGLISPHIVRMIFGESNKQVIPLSFIFGSVILLLADTLARSISSTEIPISIVTSLIGAPFLAFLLWKVGKSPWK